MACKTETTLPFQHKLKKLFSNPADNIFLLDKKSVAFPPLNMDTSSILQVQVAVSSRINRFF